MIISTLVPNNYYQPWEATKSFLEVAGYYKIIHSQGPYIYDNRNQLLKKAKKEEEALLMIDSDIVFTLEDVKRMEEHVKTKDAVTGIYVLNPPFSPPAIFKRTENDYEYTLPPTELSTIDACGAGFLVLSYKVVETLPSYAFNNIFESSMHGEDISVCHRLKEFGFKLYCDPEIKVGQVRSNILYYD